ncbi:MAG: hypothetical protein K2Q09_01025, partial [Phycisphaerales bacterium]|nr:hypothetical protein [Phycisphaerales bacterium]
MTSGPFQPVPTGPIDEADLLGVVEGQALAGDRAAKVREALANDPALAELVTLLRADRDAVASLPTVAAPHDLLDRVEAQLEREALVGLARTEAAAFDDHLPVSAVVPQRRRWVSARVGGVLAGAAAVALIAGGVLMMVPGKRARPLPPGNGLADAGAGDERGGPSVAGAGVGVRHGDETTTPGAVPAPGPVEVAAAKPETALVGPVLPDDAFVARAAGPTIEELLAAAVEGRLVLRLRTDERTARARLDDVNATARTVRVSLLAADASAGVGRALAAAYSRPAPVSVRPPAGPEQPGVASGT